MSKFLIGLCTLLFIVTFTPSIHADPIVVTSGSLTIPGFFRAPSYSLSGENFTLTGSGGEPGNTGPQSSCFPCVSGNLINVNSFFAGSSLGHGSVTIDGTTFSNLVFAGQLEFTGDPVVVPLTMSSVTLTAPFTFTGTLRGCETTIICLPQDVVFSTELTGSGLVFIDLLFFQSSTFSLFQFQRATYVFGPTEIPEPMSLLLLAGGLAALGGAQLKRRR